MGSVVEMILGKDIVLDQEAFQKAAQDMSQLAGKLQQLREDIQQMLAKIHLTLLRRNNQKWMYKNLLKEYKMASSIVIWSCGL